MRWWRRRCTPRKPRSSACHDRRSVIAALLALPPYVRSRLLSALESRQLVPPYSDVAVRSTVGGDHQDGMLQVLREWERIGVSPEAGVIWLNSLARAADRAPAPDFVWTGPEVVGLHARDTRRVYEELIGSAQHSIWVCSYAFFDGPTAFATLAGRLDANPLLKVTLLLNIERRRGDTTAADTLVRRYADHFWGKAWPGKTRPRVYYDPRSVADDGPGGVLHAKAVVADDEAVFITSANLTEAAFDRNIELGLLVRDRTLAATTVLHFQTLIDQGLLHLLPSS